MNDKSISILRTYSYNINMSYYFLFSVFAPHIYDYNLSSDIGLYQQYLPFLSLNSNYFFDYPMYHNYIIVIFSEQ
jgi:hypothetical protein